MARTFNTSLLPAERQVAWWQEVMSEVYYKVDVYSSHTDGLRGQIVEHELDALSITFFSADNQRVLRTSSKIVADDDDSFVLVIPKREHLFYSQAGRNGFLPPGDGVLVQTQAFYELSCPDDFENITIKMPARLLRQRIPFAEDHCARAYPTDHAMTAIISDFAHWIVEHRETMPEPLVAPMAGQLVDMVAALLESEARQAEDLDRPTHHQLRMRIEAYAREHMFEPELNARRVAEAVGISPSYLHRLFRPAGISFWRWVIENRLQRAYEMLTHPAYAQRSIAQIAYGSGFANQAHFSHLFRKQFGLPPRDARARAHDTSFVCC